jgi:uncharacterized protein
MGFQLDDVEVRVLGALLEKEATTPEYYPLSLNALINACNQKSNRDPVVSYDEETVEQALERLRAKGLVLRMSGPDMRVPKHAHRLSEVFNFGRRESAVMCVLMLRGPQTPGELRGRAERMHAFEDLAAVEACLNRLMEWESGPLVVRLPRQPGFKEVRFGHLLAGDVRVVEGMPAVVSAAPPVLSSNSREQLLALQATMEELQREVADLKRQLADFRRQFE